MKWINNILVLLVLLPLFAGAQSKQIIVHDPVAIEANNQYYMFSTGVGIAAWHSPDLENWQFLTQVFQPIPEWAKAEVPKFDGNMWAPDIVQHNKLFYLFYSVSSFASNRSCIGVATNTTLDPKNPEYKWVDHGKVIESTPGRDNWNAIDPNIVFDDEGTPWMAFGSFWGGLKIVKMSPDLLSIAQPQEWHTIASRSRDPFLDETDPGDGAIEAPFIFKKNGYYYLFVSFDLCCRGERSTYNVRVGRSKLVTGPYLDKDGKQMTYGGGTLVITGDDKFYGMGHNSVYTLKGADYMFSHAYDKLDNGKPKLIKHLLTWDNAGWPTATAVK